MSYNIVSHSHWGLDQFFGETGGGGSLKFHGGGGGSEKRQSLLILGLQRLASLLKNLCRGS